MVPGAKVSHPKLNRHQSGMSGSPRRQGDPGRLRAASGLVLAHARTTPAAAGPIRVCISRGSRLHDSEFRSPGGIAAKSGPMPSGGQTNQAPDIAGPGHGKGLRGIQLIIAGFPDTPPLYGRSWGALMRRLSASAPGREFPSSGRESAPEPGGALGQFSHNNSGAGSPDGIDDPNGDCFSLIIFFFSFFGTDSFFQGGAVLRPRKSTLYG